MGDDDKPFACNISGCSMRFSNEDHLTVHRKKHEMSLSLNSPNILKDTFVDQTPTPTKLLKNCYDVGLFQDLGIHPNPFDEQFRKATQSGTPSVSTTSGPELDQDSLNTPSVPLMTADVNLAVSSTTDTLEAGSAMTEPQPVIPDPETSTDGTTPFTPSSNSCDTDLSQVVVEEYNLDQLDCKDVLPATLKTIAKEPNARVKICPRRVVQMPVITSVGTLRQTALKSQMVLVSKATCSSTSTQPVIAVAAPTPTTVIQSVPTVASSIVTPSTTSTPVIQLIVKLDGQSMPFNIPIPALPSAASGTRVVSTPNAVTIQPTQNTAREVLKGSMEAKMTRKVVNMVSSSSNCQSSQVLLASKPPTTIGAIHHNNPVATVQPTIRSTFTPGRKRKDYEEDDPQEKRRKFLERNRAAATRCRLKKKKWVDELEGKCKELANHNAQLQKEVALLRNEVANLKTLLLAHKDCPITQQQMKSNGQQPQVFSLSTLTSVCATPQGSNSYRTLDSACHVLNKDSVIMETVQIDEGSDDSVEDSNDDCSVPSSSDF